MSIKIENRPITQQDKEKPIVVIAAAIAAYSGGEKDEFIVRSIRPKRQNNPLWSSVGRQQQMEQRSRLITKSCFSLFAAFFRR